MMAMKVGIQDKKELERFTNVFILKSAQVIVSSRLGYKISTQCRAAGDWFNLALPEAPEVLEDAKRALSDDAFLTKLPLCVEISLRTAEGDVMVLEQWCLGIRPEQYEYSGAFKQTVYNRMGVLMKSLVSVTRVTPAYKLSRRQGEDSYVLLYRCYVGEPILHVLGDGYKLLKVGQLCMPIGTMHLTVCYRTKMTISPTTASKDNSIMLKSDHFNTNMSPKLVRIKQIEDKNVVNDGMKIGAFACRKREYKPEFILPDIPLSNLLPRRKEDLCEEDNDLSNNCEELECSKTSTIKDDDQNGNSPTESLVASSTTVSTSDDFIMVDLKTPFASRNANSELGMFYREWQSAPPLKTFTHIPTLAEQVQDLTRQLENFELDMNKYDDMLNSLCRSPNNN